MPYIKNEDRQKFTNILKQLPKFENKGEMEFAIFYIMQHYMSNHEFKYAELHNTVYAAAHCSDEFRRRFLDGREDVAMFNNGDITIDKIN